MSDEALKQPWWRVGRAPTMDSHFGYSWALVGLGMQALEGGPAVLERHFSAQLKEGDTVSGLQKRFLEAFPNWRLVNWEQPQHRQDTSEISNVCHDGAMYLHFDGDSKVTASIAVCSQIFAEAFQAFWKQETTESIPKGRVHVLITTSDGPEFKSMGVGGQPLIRDNYDSKVLEGYDRVVKDLRSSAPGGRVAIFDGSPGTGKTFLIRGLLEDVQDVLFIIVPANLVEQLAQPSLVPALMGLRRNSADKAMVFIIEDADEVLAPRMSDNMSAVSAILNLGDGILGQLLDVRIVATTNTVRSELDDAIMRPGRLSANIHVGPLGAIQAEAVYQRLVGGERRSFADGKISTQMTLAQVYSLARADGWQPPPKKTKLGFSNTETDDDESVPPPSSVDG